ncbi:hypothetical protein HMPREF1544_03263 [Mucor circinelloides 1006PhL]|uniref:Prokaryotic-type class I peptide chain release factors domain-containing protein n=1 Tax=Mucor circinelloides f. circinelloides (strain 1006PhL) TaxID=1220926 RepID=S2KC75_MUCC1|nr:hypothetical protein HMPREF1544_03263 [Mucor circinelloides 1006PhL]
MLQSYKLLTRRYYSSKIWTFKEATAWQQSFNQSHIPKDNVSISFSRSSGPGGQNVNKVSTKVDMRLALNKAHSWLPEYAIENLKKSTQLRKSKDNEIIITSDKTRSQAKNIQDCYEKLTSIIKESVTVAKEPDQATLLRIEQL